MKPILIDALHINMGGALMILNHFVDRLVAKDIDFVLLKDDRCPRLRSEEKVKSIEVMSCAESVRKKYYKLHRNDFKTVLCLGNIPPAIRMPVFVNTYIHNVSILNIPQGYPFKWKVLASMKRTYIRLLSCNTDGWIVQTDNTLNLVEKYLPIKNKRLQIMPFYHIPEDIKPLKNTVRDDYVFIGEHTYAKGHEYLIEAWSKLAGKGFYKTLHMTVSSPKICALITDARAKGANIVNHGRIPFEDVVKIYHKSKAIVYPSLNESLGLGIIEAAEAGCDVIGCDLPYIYSVCRPSETFIPNNSDAIVDAVLKYENNRSNKTVLTISDKADELISVLTDNYTYCM